MENSIENAQGTADPVEVPSQVTTVITDCVMTPQEKPFDESNAARMSSNRPPKRSKMQSILIVGACTGTNILNVAGVASVSNAMPVMARSLNMSSDTIPWIISAFALSSGCLLLLFGRLADIYGRKLIWQIGAFWTIMMTIGCAFTRNGTQIIIFRALAGAGPAAMVPAALGILAQSFPPSRARSTAFATFAAGGPVGGALGIIFGGVLASYASWRGLFYFLIGLSLVVWIVGALVIDRDGPTDTDKRVDWLGAFLITTGLTLITFAISDAASAGWSSPVILSLLIIGIVLVVTFISWEYYLIQRIFFPPLMPLNIWARDHGRFAAMQAVGFLEWACFNSLLTYMTLYYQNYQGLDPFHSMLRFIPLPIVGFMCNVIVVFAVGRISGAYLLGLGLFATSAATLIFALIDPDAPYWQYGFPAAVISVFGADFTFACGTLFIAKIALPHEQSVAAAIYQTVVSFGISVGLSITTVAQVAGMKKEADRLGISIAPDALAKDIPPSILLKGYRTAQFAALAFGLCGLMVVAIFLHNMGIVGMEKKKKKMLSEEGRTEVDERMEEETQT